METIPQDINKSGLYIQAGIEDLNPLPEGFQWPSGVPLPMPKKGVVTARCPLPFPSEIQKFSLEIAYTDSKGTWVRCISAPYLYKGEIFSVAAPLIWDAQTMERQYKASFSWHSGSKEIRLFLKTYFTDTSLPVQQVEKILVLKSETPVHHIFYF